MEVLCVPSATHMPCIHRSQNKVFSMTVFISLFSFGAPLYIRSQLLSQTEQNLLPVLRPIN